MRLSIIKVATQKKKKKKDGDTFFRVPTKLYR